MKVVWIVIGGILIGALGIGGFFFMQQKPETKPVELMPVANETVPTPSLVPEAKKYQSESGFSFEYPSDVVVKENETDASTYANLTLTSDQEGSIDIKITDTKLKDLAAWKKQNPSMKVVDATLADLPAQEESLNLGKTTLTAIGDGVLYQIILNQSENFDYWNNVYQGIIDSFTFELPETPTAAPKKSGSSAPAASGGDIYEEETIE